MAIKVIKIGGADYFPSEGEIEDFRKAVAADKEILNQSNPNVKIEEVDTTKAGILVVKLGGENYRPTLQDLETWRDIFEEARNDPDFIIFTHADVNFEHIEVDTDTVVTFVPPQK